MWEIFNFFLFVGLAVFLVNGITIDLVRTTGGHLASTFYIGPQKQSQFILLDLTETNFWVFGSSFFIDLPRGGSGPYNISSDPMTLFNVTNATNSEPLIYRQYSPMGFYDASLYESLKPIRINYISTGNVTLRNSSTQIYILPVRMEFYYEKWSHVLFDGVFGVGNLLIRPALSNYMSNYMTNISTILLYTPRNVAHGGKLVIDSDIVPKECEKFAVAVNLSKNVYLRYGDFEFNITAAAGKYDNSSYYYSKVWPSAISTMSSFITVDNDTWKYLMQKLDVTLDHYSVRNSDISPPFYKIECEDAEKLKLTITLKKDNGDLTNFVIPGRSLIQPNPNGECLLKVNVNAVDAWVLGTPFLENYCIKIDPNTSKIYFSNTTDFMGRPNDDVKSPIFSSMVSGHG